MNEKKNIIIVGAGFGGITAAIKLAARKNNLKEYRIILVDKNPYQLYTPALYEIAAIPRQDANLSMLRHAITIALEHIVSKRRITFLQGEFTGLNQKNKTIALKDGTLLGYHYLILALGSETNYFNIPGLAQYALSLKTFGDGVNLRNQIEKLISEKEGVLHIVIGGGGPTGVELAAEFMSFICRLQKIYKKGNTCKTEVLLIEAAEDILPGFSPWIVKKARSRLQQLGIHIKTNTQVSAATRTEIETNEESIHYDLFIWAGGVRGNSICNALNFPLNKKGQLKVNDYLEIAEHIFAIGDNASFSDSSGKSIPNSVPIAEGQARRTAKNILQMIQNKQKTPYRAPTRYPYILAVGNKYAIADLILIRFAGFFGWLLKQLVELRYLLFILPLGKAISIWLYTIKIYSANDGDV